VLLLCQGLLLLMNWFNVVNLVADHVDSIQNCVTVAQDAIAKLLR